jgi:dihydrofolate reductase
VSVIVIQFTTLDGIVSDPDGSSGTPTGGWAFRHGPGTADGDKFRLGSTLDNGVMLLGRKTWQLFSRLWPGRDDPFSVRMNAASKLIASRTLTDTSAWANSRVVEDDLVDPADRPPSYLECLSAEQLGAAVLARYAR